MLRTIGFAAVVALTFALAACSGKDGQSGASALVATSQEPSGSHCAAGGTAIHAGMDTNANGVLDAAEVTSTSYVCSGAAGSAGVDGTSWLVAVGQEAAGANCAAGGVVVRSGRDANRDGVLQGSEASSTQYVCNGEDGSPGSNGTNGFNSLVAVGEVASGSTECPYGGKSISYGFDLNRNDVLDPTEIGAGSTSYVCNGAPGAAGAAGEDGAPGAMSIVTVTPEAPGANCANGGVKVRSWVDLNGNGLLDTETETWTTAFVCNG